MFDVKPCSCRFVQTSGMMAHENKRLYYLYHDSYDTIKGPDNPTSQLLPIMSFKGCSGDGEGRKDKGCGEGSRS